MHIDIYVHFSHQQIGFVFSNKAQIFVVFYSFSPVFSIILPFFDPAPVVWAKIRIAFFVLRDWTYHLSLINNHLVKRKRAGKFQINLRETVLLMRIAYRVLHVAFWDC